MNREQKAVAIAEIAARIEQSSAVFAVDYRGISVSQAAELRARLRDADATFTVVKNSLTERAADQVGADTLKEFLIGPTALTFVRGDVATAAKAIADYARATQLLPLKGGLMDGGVLDSEQIRAISRLPSREALYGQLVGVVASPVTGLVRTLNALVSGLAVALGQVQEKKESGEIPAAAPPVAEAPPEEPVAEARAAEQAPAEEPATEEASADQAPAEEPTTEEEPITEEEASPKEPPAEEPTAEEPTAEEPTAEEPTAEEPTAQEPTAEGATAEGATAEEPPPEVALAEDTADASPAEQATGDEATADTAEGAAAAEAKADAPAEASSTEGASDTSSAEEPPPEEALAEDTADAPPAEGGSAEEAEPTHEGANQAQSSAQGGPEAADENPTKED